MFWDTERAEDNFFPLPKTFPRACLKNAFWQMYFPLSGRFVPKGYDMPKKGGVAGYVDEFGANSKLPVF